LEALWPSSSAASLKRVKTENDQISQFGTQHFQSTILEEDSNNSQIQERHEEDEEEWSE